MAGTRGPMGAPMAAEDPRHRDLSDLIFARIAARLRAMSSPSRLRILHALEDGELAVHEILARVGGSQANVSKHLNVLRYAGLVASRREGVSVYYSISDEAVFAICRIVCDSLLDRANADVGAIEEARAVMMAGRE